MSSSGNFEILYAEDNPNDAELTMRGFKKNNLINNVIHVRDGEEALEFLYCKGKFDKRIANEFPLFVLLDLKMPKVDGLEVLRTMKGDDNLKMIPVVMLTSSSEERDIVESYKLGVNSYIVKPVEFEKLVITVAEIGQYWCILNKSVS
ncbi:response regulator receiver domain protein [Leptospira broomii serovar Hurstbridge str. 5399]|uniref:Response regulator receiver domain protein n=1 Tax=Leptospira broomii serovar Hurstbridge str. 5399 TaxID=1049789 RepID=T0FAQ3_9LEPT|nr:response regulator [Leptospira broomii]EQA44612.1 response regulator receiver domain protein [Leptospira broomii serovar Hurstbridge str. 5399]